MANATTTMASILEGPTTPPPTPKTTLATIDPTTPSTPTTTTTREIKFQQSPPSSPQTSPPQTTSSPSLPPQTGTSPSPGLLNPQTRWGCLIQTYPTSLAPKSLKLIHNPAPGKCRCHGREEVIVKDYILRWVSYRIDELKEHPVKATTWARASCEYLGLGGQLDGILGRVERLFVGDLS